MESLAIQPGFFLVGAQKAATSALDFLLEQHPDIFLPAIKEPNFVASQFWKRPFQGPGDDRIDAYIADTPEKYQTLYVGAHADQLTGDASTANLYYWRQAIPVIKQQFGDVPIVICLRNPVDRAYSAYMHLRRDMRETLSFEAALKQEDSRRTQNWSFIWFYRDGGYYFEQVQAYLQNFSRVKIYLFEDIRDDALQTAQGCYDFLGVDASFGPRLNIPVNTSGEPVNRSIHRLLFKPGKVKGEVFKVASRIIPSRILAVGLERLRSKNLKRVEMNAETRTELQAGYHESLSKLETLIQRDLSGWLL